jgi:transposase
VIQLAPQMRILVAIEPVDLRKGIDGLAQLCREKLGADPFSGYLFIFRGQRATAIKLLAYDSCDVPAYVELSIPSAGPTRLALTQLST